MNGPKKTNARAFRRSLHQSRALLGRDLAQHPWLVWYSPAEVSLRRCVERLLYKYAQGAVLDAGSGYMPYRSLIRAIADSYTSLDVDDGIANVDLAGDVTDMVGITDNSFDLILCSEVLEHVQRPRQAVAEFVRVLKPGGVAIITTPHMSRVHDAPNDYFRFTTYGLEELAKSEGLEVISTERAGSIFSLIGHQITTALVVPLWRTAVLKWLVFIAVAALITLPALVVDRIPLLRALLPLNVVLIARKPVAS